MLILEGDSSLRGKIEYLISFPYKGSEVKFESMSLKDISGDIFDWLYNNGYKFDGKSNNSKNRRLLNEVELENLIKTTTYGRRSFHNVAGKNLYLINSYNSHLLIAFIIEMLVDFGVEKNQITTNGFDVFKSKIKKFDDIDKLSTPDVFKVNNFNTDDLKFTNDESDNDDIETFSTRFGIPTDFKAVQAQDEKETKEYVKNPFRQSICVLGESGAGKSTTLENILEAEKHEFEFIIPSASTTGLLSQFSPSKSGYIKSRLGRMLVDAFNNPKKLYTVVFDECHKSNTIEMINDELLQAISIKRNNERRFISLDEDTSELYKGVETHRGNIIIPDNFGFIFISSKPRIIANNTDFFNRVDLVVLKSYEEEKIQTSKELLSKVLPYEEKIKLASTRND